MRSFRTSLVVLGAIFLLSDSIARSADVDSVADEERRQTAEKIARHMEDIRSGPVPYKNIREALDVIDKSTDTGEIQKAYDYLPRVPVQDHEDLKTLYQEAKSREENVPLFASDEELMKYGGAAEPIARRLQGCTDLQFQDDIVALLKKEVATAKSAGRPSIRDISTRHVIKNGLIETRIESLISAAGAGKNDKARGILWEIVDNEKDGHFGQYAADALGKIGNPADLDRLIAMIKKNPNLRLSLGSFGSQLLPRLMREMDDPRVSQEAKYSLSLDLAAAGSHENLASFVPLLEDPNNAVVNAAAKVVENSLLPTDEAIIKQVFKSRSDQARISVAIGVCERSWDDRYVPLLIEMLKRDSNEQNRAEAASCLGQHKVQAAVPALKEALQDFVPLVRDQAKFALKKISGEVK